MKNFILISTLCYFLSGCLGNFQPEEPPMPSLNKKEFYLKDSLEKMGYSNIIFRIPYVGYTRYGTSNYILLLDSPGELKNNNYDSIKNIEKNIAFYLYKNIITDSILFDIESIRIELKIKNTNNVEGYSIIEANISKKMLIDSTGIQIIKSHNKYERLNLFNLKHN
jgi:hypothetical protein